jgi:hypothetical protein
MLIAMLLSTHACGLMARNCSATDTKVIFDIPSKVECVEVRCEKCAAAHPTMKVIEARFRISASFVEGRELSTEDFVYLISSPDMRLKVLDFLPNTTLESLTAEDRIEVTDSTEISDVASGEARVGYSVLSLSGTKNLSNKKTESNHYQKVAHKNLVLASGTINRGHGVFYKLRPSNEGSLEGAKEFVLLCIVPKTWRGDWCTVICSARTNKKTSTTASAGIEQAHVGLYLSGDRAASQLSDDLTQIQVAHGGLLARQLTKEAGQSVEAMHSIPTNQLGKFPSSEWLFRAVKFKPNSRQTSLDAARKSLIEIETRLSELAGTLD